MKVRYAVISSLLFCLVGFNSAHATTSPATCLQLVAEQSEDKNYYRLTATASDSDITGYEFDFGDKQSYTFTVHDAPGKDKKTATVRHTYEKNGIFTATAKVIGTGDSNSAKCSTQIVIGQVAELPPTGPSKDLRAIAALVAVSVAIYGFAFITRTPR